jgi:hypothetical protein
MRMIDEKIKVRFGFDVDFAVKFTDNGVVLPRELLTGKAQQLNWFLVRQLWEQNDEFYN